MRRTMEKKKVVFWAFMNSKYPAPPAKLRSLIWVVADHSIQWSLRFVAFWKWRAHCILLLIL